MASLIARFCRFLLIVLFLHEKYQSFCELPNVMMVHLNLLTQCQTNKSNNKRIYLITQDRGLLTPYHNKGGYILYLFILLQYDVGSLRCCRVCCANDRSNNVNTYFLCTYKITQIFNKEWLIGKFESNTLGIYDW